MVNPLPCHGRCDGLDTRTDRMNQNVSPFGYEGRKEGTSLSFLTLGHHMTKKRSANPKADAITTEKNEATLKSASSLTVEGVVKKVTDVNLLIGKQLNEVTQQIATAVQEFQNVAKAVELKKEEFAQIHDKDLLAKEIEEMEADAETRRAELDQADRDYAQGLSTARQIATEKHNREIADLEVQRSRAKLDFDFNFEQAKKNAKHQLDEELRTIKLQERDRKELLEKEWSAREEAVSKNEVIFKEMQKQVYDFPEILKKETEKAASIAGSTVKRQWEHSMELVQKDAQAAASIAAMTIKSLNETITQLQTQLTAAQNRITAADTKVAEIATKALESTNGQSALNALQTSLAQNAQNGTGKRA